LRKAFVSTGIRLLVERLGIENGRAQVTFASRSLKEHLAVLSSVLLRVFNANVFESGSNGPWTLVTRRNPLARRTIWAAVSSSADFSAADRKDPPTPNIAAEVMMRDATTKRERQLDLHHGRTHRNISIGGSFQFSGGRGAKYEATSSILDRVLVLFDLH
jgi:hypothetical protein